MDENPHVQLNQQTGEVLYHSSESQIEIRQLDGRRRMHFGDKAVQACMSLSKSHQLLLPYTKAMLAGLVFIELPKRLLNLGLGGGSFIRFFDKTLPKLLVESVDNSTEVIDLSRRFFEISESSPVHCMNAEDFVADAAANYDVIFCDLFADSAHPDCMFDEAFYLNCHSRLGPSGLLAVNLLITDEAKMVTLLQQVRKHFAVLVLMAVPDHTNTILFAIKQPVVDSEFLVARARQLQADFGIDLTPYIERFMMLASAVDGA